MRLFTFSLIVIAVIFTLGCSAETLFVAQILRCR